MKKLFLRILVFVVIVVLVFTPYLLVIDFKKYSPVVFIIWIFSAAYFIMLQRREAWNALRRKQESEEEEKKNNVSRETS